MKRIFTKEEENIIHTAVKLANPAHGLDGFEMMVSLTELILQHIIEKNPHTGFPDAHKKKHQKKALETVINQLSELIESLIMLDDECLESMAQCLTTRPITSQLIQEKSDAAEIVGDIPLPHVGGKLMWVLRDLRRAASEAIPSAGSPKFWRGSSTKDYFVGHMSPLWIGANEDNKASSYVDSDFSEFLHSLYSIAYPEDSTGLERSIKKYARWLNGTQLKDK